MDQMGSKKPVRFLLFFILICLNPNNVNGDPKRVKFNKIVVDYGNQVYSIEKHQKHDLNVKILISIVVKNHAHSLPTFLATLETLKCPTFNRKCDLR